ncbi:MAG: catechol 2,3-dioxygenase [Ktedonobacteraceae bacterium]
MQEIQHNVLDPATHVGLVTIAVSSLERSLQYYQSGLGFTIREQKERTVLLGAATGSPILALVEQRNAQPQPAHTTGLYHFAVLLPTRKDLGRFLSHLVESQMPLGGYADHLVSEALYLSDPDGNGIEVYRDRPRSTWTWQNGQVAMASDPIDLEALMAEGRRDTSVWSGLPAHTTLGHMHLRVANIPQGVQFYHGVLGFDIVLQMPSALFISAGGYHHHIGMNIWESRNGPQPPHNAVGLRFFTIQLPDAAALTKVVTRLQAVNWSSEQHEVGVTLHDPWGNKLLLTTHDIASVEAVQSVIKAL